MLKSVGTWKEPDYLLCKIKFWTSLFFYALIEMSCICFSEKNEIKWDHWGNSVIKFLGSVAIVIF